MFVFCNELSVLIALFKLLKNYSHPLKLLVIELTSLVKIVLQSSLIVKYITERGRTALYLYNSFHFSPTEKGQLYTCGDGRHGKLALGQESYSNVYIPTRVPRFSKFVVEKVSGSVWCMYVLTKIMDFR